MNITHTISDSRQQYTVADAPLTWRHWWITFVASLGQLIGTAVATVAGVIIPLMVIIPRYADMPSAMQGLIGAADLIGIMIGSTIIGRMSDRFGYLPFFRGCPVVILAGSLTAICCPDVWVLTISLFVIGLGIGGEYSLDSDYTSVLMPDRHKRMMLGLVKTGAAFGNILGAGVAYLMVSGYTSAYGWPRLMWIIAGISVLMLLSRIYFFESPKWLLEHGRREEAMHVVHKFLGPHVGLNPPASAGSNNASTSPAHRLSLPEFCRRFKDKVVLTGIPWSCEGLGVYGIGVFIPLLVMTLGIGHEPASATAIERVAESVKTTLWISCIILPGFLAGIWLVNRRVREVRLQSAGFWACGILLIVLLFSYRLGWPVWISLVAFMAFELFLNIGPHLVTYLLPPKVYPVDVRGQGTGIAASIGKAGAVAGVFIVPILLKWGGGTLVLGVSAAIMVIGAIVTSVYGHRAGEG